MLETIPTLRTLRLALRPLSHDDVPHLLDLARDDEVARYLHEGPVTSSEDVAARVQRALNQWKVRGYGMMAVEDESGFAGRIGVYHPANAAEPLLVYVFRQRVWGKGYATEGVKHFLEWMSGQIDHQHLFAHIDPLNTASERVVRKFGAKKTGMIDRGGTALDVWSIIL